MQPTTSDAEESHAMSCSSMRCTPAVYVYVFVPVACVSVCTLFAFSSQLLSLFRFTHTWLLLSSSPAKGSTARLEPRPLPHSERGPRRLP